MFEYYNIGKVPEQTQSGGDPAHIVLNIPEFLLYTSVKIKMLGHMENNRFDTDEEDGRTNVKEVRRLK